MALGASACGSDGEPAPASSSDSSASGAAPVSSSDALGRIADGATVIDVRTPEEFAAGHLDGATNLDVQADDFADRLGELPREDPYVVYCATGRRATGAVEQMEELGFTDVVNGGGYADLADG
ncbi:rhodanese-like domain-containing protein [Nocardioides hwasunensis]|uniref:Rhodanese-like domain-containing protein n=1 Tax=Nocardioides hwasunensis TaxID=397258 RepID=A0ABR8MKY8_9ACTN|nr:rhodanese-like domain-containing protein [Nocardioides hwasunensis]